MFFYRAVSCPSTPSDGNDRQGGCADCFSFCNSSRRSANSRTSARRAWSSRSMAETSQCVSHINRWNAMNIHDIQNRQHKVGIDTRLQNVLQWRIGLRIISDPCRLGRRLLSNCSINVRAAITSSLR